MSPTIVAIVEGHGDSRAAPVLIRKIAESMGVFDLTVPPPIRCPRSKIVRGEGAVHSEELARAIKLASLKLPSKQDGAILLLLDADESCPASLGPELLAEAKTARSDVLIRVVLANREYEAWFLAAITSLRGQRGILADASPPADPESISDAKGLLESMMDEDRSYSETIDQPALSAVLDLELASSCRSFTKLKADIAALLTLIATPST